MAVPIRGTGGRSVTGANGQTVPHIVNNGSTIPTDRGSHSKGSRPPQDRTMQSPAYGGSTQSTSLTRPVFGGVRVGQATFPEPTPGGTDGCPTVVQQIEINRRSGITETNPDFPIFSPYLPDCGWFEGWGDNPVNPELKCCDLNELGMCRYKFKIEPQNIFNYIEHFHVKGKTIPNELKKRILCQTIKLQPVRAAANGVHYKRRNKAEFICNNVKDLLECINPDLNAAQMYLPCGDRFPAINPNTGLPSVAPYGYVGQKCMVAKRHLRTEAEIRNPENWRFLPVTGTWKWNNGSTLDSILKCIALSKAKAKIYSPAGFDGQCDQIISPANKSYKPYSRGKGHSPAFEVVLSGIFPHGPNEELIYIEIISVLRTVKYPPPPFGPEPSDYITTVEWRWGTVSSGVLEGGLTLCHVAENNDHITWSEVQIWKNRNLDGTVHEDVEEVEDAVDMFGGETPMCDSITKQLSDGVYIVFHCVHEWYKWWGGGVESQQDVDGIFGPWWVRAARWGRYEEDVLNDFRCKAPIGQPDCSCKRSLFMDWLACIVDCDNYCCKYGDDSLGVAFPSSLDETDMTKWSEIVALSEIQNLLRCTCRDNEAEETDCGCRADPDDSDPFTDDTMDACVSNFEARPYREMNMCGVLLTWEIPESEDFAGCSITIEQEVDPYYGESLWRHPPYPRQDHDDSAARTGEATFHADISSLDCDTEYTFKIWTFDHQEPVNYSKLCATVTVTTPTDESDPY